MGSHPSDIRWMRLALSLAARGLGQVWPNPAVGCVIVKGGRVVGRGWTQPSGRPHAETVALAQAGENAKGATAFVSLEPCAHTGKAPPCANALIDAGISRVVVGATDPDPRVSGKGLAMLQQAGIAVETDVLSAEAAAINAGFFKRVTNGLPFVTLKLACSLDGRIATKSGDSKWITNAQSRAFVHHLRASHDAIMVGSGTVLADNPDLRVRLAGRAHQSPLRVVLDTQGQMPRGSRMLSTATDTPVWICHGEKAPINDLTADGVALIPCKTDDDGLDLNSALTALAARGITRVFCEGGGTVAASLIRAGLVDQLITFHAGIALGADATPALASLGLDKIADATRFHRTDLHQFGDDIMSVWQPK